MTQFQRLHPDFFGYLLCESGARGVAMRGPDRSGRAFAVFGTSARPLAIDEGALRERGGGVPSSPAPPRGQVCEGWPPTLLEGRARLLSGGLLNVGCCRTFWKGAEVADHRCDVI